MESLWAWDRRISQRAIQALAELQPGHVDTVSYQIAILSAVNNVNISRAQMARERARMVRERTGQLLQGRKLDRDQGQNVVMQDLCSALEKLNAGTS